MKKLGIWLLEVIGSVLGLATAAVILFVAVCFIVGVSASDFLPPAEAGRLPPPTRVHIPASPNQPDRPELATPNDGDLAWFPSGRLGVWQVTSFTNGQATGHFVEFTSPQRVCRATGDGTVYDYHLTGTGACRQGPLLFKGGRISDYLTWYDPKTGLWLRSQDASVALLEANSYCHNDHDWQQLRDPDGGQFYLQGGWQCANHHNASSGLPTPAGYAKVHDRVLKVFLSSGGWRDLMQAPACSDSFQPRQCATFS